MAKERRPKPVGIRVVRGFTEEERRRSHRQGCAAWLALFAAILGVLLPLGMAAFDAVASRLAAHLNPPPIIDTLPPLLRGAWVLAIVLTSLWITWHLHRWATRR